MSELDEFIEHCRTRAQQANLAYEMYGQRPHEFHAQYAVDVSRLCDALEEAEREKERLRKALETIADAYRWPAGGALNQVLDAISGGSAHRRLPTVVRIAEQALAAQDSEAEEGKP